MRVIGRTHLPGGKAVTVDRELPDAATPGEAIAAALQRRKDKGRPFVGDSVFLMRGAHGVAYLIEAAEWTGHLTATPARVHTGRRAGVARTPEELVGALQDRVFPASGRLLATRPVRIPRK